MKFLYDDAIDVIVIGTLTLSCVNIVRSTRNRILAFPPSTYISTFPLLVLLTLSASAHFKFSLLTNNCIIKSPSRLIRYVGFAAFFLAILWILSQSSHMAELPGSHPIDSLMEIAEQHYSVWTQQAVASGNIQSATEEYHRRYDRSPPPRFDTWYDYAVNRHSAVIDDFDTVNEDLAPFWALKPSELRMLTAQAVSDPSNEVVLVRVRGGTTSFGKVIPTHKWMFEGLVKMMRGFEAYLPDMDLALNINDEPRVAVPYNKFQRLTSKIKDGSGTANTQEKVSSNRERINWSSNRAIALDALSMPNGTAKQSPPQGLFDNWSFQKNFRRFGSVGCPPSSYVHQLRTWDPTILCTSCAAPHSEGIFLGNWTLASSPCHQPDLSDLHGFYLSPSAYKPTRELLPIFSQSKAAGYMDILYPSPWNYIGKVTYNPSVNHTDPPFSEKQNILFWRGGTTEGFSDMGTWMGMARQRFVHMISNSAMSMPILLPTSKGESTYVYGHLPSNQVHQHPLLQSSAFTASVGFASNITRCYGRDCDLQAVGFGFHNQSDFQDHWQYKYLMDLDGAGFSGRFLPFLQSHSMPFKAALFREWYDSRLKAWKHFVPIDLRLHGLWSTVAYFAGNMGKPREPLAVGPKDRGEYIAESGREWAAKALRKEDMEIYLFRLLLEWGRLTDDRRDELGFQL